jgi:hypothetical protein
MNELDAAESATELAKESRFRYTRSATGLLVGLFAFAIYCTSLLYVDYRSKDDVYFGGDHAHYAAKLERLGPRTSPYKHPLFGLILGSAYQVLVKTFHLPSTVALALVFGLTGSLAVSLMFFLLERFFCSPLNAALVAAAYAAAFSNVVIFGITETYSLSVLFALFVFLLVLETNAKAYAIGPATIGIAGGIAGWTTPVGVFPVASYAFLAFWNSPNLLGLRRAATAGAIGVTIAILPLLRAMYVAPKWWDKKMLGGKYESSIQNLGDFQSILDTLASFFSFAIVSPEDMVLHYYTAANAFGYFQSGLRLLAVVAWLGLFAFSIFRVFSIKETAMLAGALLGSLVLLLGYYLYHGSKECMLYTPLGLAVLFIVVGMAINRSKAASFLLVPFILLLLASNVMPLYKTSATLQAKQVNIDAPKGELSGKTPQLQ